MSEFDLEKIMANGGKCRTRDGKSARIICTDIINDEPILALVKHEDGLETAETYSRDGKYFRPKQYERDLINPPEVIERWVNIYNPSWEDVTNNFPHKTLDGADNARLEGHVGTVKYTIEDGKLVSAEVVEP